MSSVSMTPDDAKAKRLCPNAAIMGPEGSQTPFCHGPQCGAWRWTLDDAFRSAVQKQAKVDDDKPPFAKSAAKVVAKPVTFGLRGHCGLGGGV
jgi:hypothetical protein